MIVDVKDPKKSQKQSLQLISEITNVTVGKWNWDNSIYKSIKVLNTLKNTSNKYQTSALKTTILLREIKQVNYEIHTVHGLQDTIW